MRKPSSVPLCLFPLLLLAATSVVPCSAARRPPAQNSRHEEQGIRAVVHHWQDDWNHHDAKALAALLTEDADVVTPGGDWLRGRAEFQDWHGRLSQPVFKDSVWTTDQIEIRFLMPDIAIAHFTWSLSGDRNPNGSARKPSRGISTWVLIKAGGRWIVRAAQSTYAPDNIPAP